MRTLPSNKIEIFPLQDVPRIDSPVDLSEIIVKGFEKTWLDLKDGDIIVIAHTIVSKAEGRSIGRNEIEVSDRARQIAEKNGFDAVQVEIALSQSERVLRDERTLITVTKSGRICNFSGIDHSNAPEGAFVMLPEDSDESAARILDSLEDATGKTLAVIISDTEGRPWRKGAVNIALGCAGINAFKHNKGKRDLYGRELQSSMVCQVDQLASAAEFLMGQADEGTPIVVIRGYEFETGSEKGKDIQRPLSECLFL